MSTGPKDDAASDDELVAFVSRLAGEATCRDEIAFAMILHAWLAARYAGREPELCEHLRPWVRAIADEMSGWIAAHERRN